MLIRRHTDDEAVALLAGLLEMADVAEMQQIEASVGENDPFISKYDAPRNRREVSISHHPNTFCSAGTCVGTPSATR